MDRRVVHLLRTYLDLTSAVIHGYLTNASRYEPAVLARRLVNLHLFPLSPVYGVSALPLLPLALNYVAFKLCRRQPYFAQMVKEIRPRLFHAHFGTEGAYSLPLKQKFGIPLVTTFYGRDAYAIPREDKWRRAYRRLFEQGERIIVLSRSMEDHLICLGCPAKKVEIVHAGIDTHEFVPPPRRPLDRGGRVKILMCGRLTEKKGTAIAIKALAALHKEYSRVSMHHIGDGPLRSEIQALINDLGLQEDVTLLGAQPRSRVLREMQSCHIFLLPSITASDGDQEGTPVVLMEAQAVEMPVVSTYHSGIPEVVLNGESGFLVPEGDVDALVERLLWLVTHPETWTEMGRAGRRYVQINYEIKVEARKLEELYDRVLAC